MQIWNLHRMKRGRIRSYSVRMWENTNQNNSTDTIYAVLKTVFQLTKSFYNSRENHFFISIIFSSKAVVTLKTAIFNSFRMKNMGFFELLNLCLIEEHWDEQFVCLDNLGDRYCEEYQIIVVQVHCMKEN